ncbi:urease accessory protein ureD [Pseudarthrobacter siccitolerans]|uniref:Urease accessory protein ureD n=1 Tax=Pseudarthrobacter siccitolerans TaxID=861266 RepID=A0A024H7H6_9MICC|nr:urease accessory protein ureD [Pseudarthrobacter siccitolerans]
MHLNIQQKKIRPKISPARIHHDVANLPRVIEVVRSKNPKSALMELCGSDGPTSPSLDAEL